MLPGHLEFLVMRLLWFLKPVTFIFCLSRTLPWLYARSSTQPSLDFAFSIIFVFYFQRVLHTGRVWELDDCLSFSLVPKVFCFLFRKDPWMHILELKREICKFASSSSLSLSSVVPSNALEVVPFLVLQLKCWLLIYNMPLYVLCQLDSEIKDQPRFAPHTCVYL